MSDLKSKVLRGGLVRVTAQGVNLTLRMVSIAVLGRILEPSDYGLVTMVTAVTGVLTLFRDFGLSNATVQSSQITNEQISALFWINIWVGLVMSLLALAVTPVLVAVYGEPRLKWISIALAGSFLINALSVQHSALLRREMRFVVLTLIEVMSLAISIIAGIAAAMSGYGYWALVVMALSAPLVYMIGVWWAVPWVPGRPARNVGVRAMVQFGVTTTVNSLVMYVAYNFEKFLVGRFLGADALGIYGRAYQLISIPNENFTGAIGEVAFSALSRVQDDRERLDRYFLNGYRMVLTLCVPVTLLCGFFAEEIVTVVIGEKWMAAVPSFRLLAPTILVFAMLNPLSWYLMSTGQAKRSLGIALMIAPVVIAGYALGLAYGINGVAVGYSIAMLLCLVPCMYWVVQGSALSVRALLSVLWRPLFASLLAISVSYGVVSMLTVHEAHLLRLLIGLPMFGALYLGILLYPVGQRAYYLGLAKMLLGRDAPMPSL